MLSLNMFDQNCSHKPIAKCFFAVYESPSTEEDANDNDENLTSFCSNIMPPNIVEYLFDIPSVTVTKKFWENIALARLEPSKCLTPLKYWAPYIAEHSKGDLVYNTEFKKGVQDTEEQQYLECLYEESLDSLLDQPG